MKYKPVAPLLIPDTVQQEPSSNIELFEAVPNPFHDQFEVRYSMKEAVEARFELRSYTGALIQVIDVEHSMPGLYQQAIEGGDLPSGIYILTMISKDGIKSVRMAKA